MWVLWSIRDGHTHHDRETEHQAKLVSEDPKQCHSPQGAVTGEELGLWLPPTHTPKAGSLPYLGGPVAMDDHWEGVIGQIPCSHMAHFKLEYDFVWGSESTVAEGPRLEAHRLRLRKNSVCP